MGYVFILFTGLDIVEKVMQHPLVWFLQCMIVALRESVNLQSHSATSEETFFHNISVTCCLWGYLFLIENGL